MVYTTIPQTGCEHNECNWGKVISKCIHFRPTYPPSKEAL